MITMLNEIAKKHNVTPAQVALNWLVHFSGKTVVAIPGAKRAHQAEESAGALHFKLSKDEMGQLNEISRSMQ